MVVVTAQGCSVGLKGRWEGFGGQWEGLRGSWEGLKDVKAGRQVDGRASKVAGGCSGG